MPLTGQPVRTLSLAIVAASSAALLLAMPRPALAQTPQDPPPAAAPRALPLLTTADLVAQSSGSGNGKKKSKPIFDYKDKPTFHLGPADISPKARVQFDSRHSQAAVADIEDQQGDVARQRIGVEGVVAKAVDFQVERELDDPNDPWRDVYVNVSKFEFAQVQYGKFKLPFGLEENTGAPNLDFVYRALVSNTLAPGRDRGVMFHGRALDKSIIYDYGVFDHDGRNAFSNNPLRVYGDQTKVFHGAVRPLRFMKLKQIRDAEIGGSWATTNLAEGLPGIRGRTVLGQTFFSANYPVNGERKRVGFEARWHPGPATIQGEYIKMTEERLGLSVEDGPLSPLQSIGWYVQGAYVITGDEKADGLTSPKRPFLQGGIGAVEVAVRVERLSFDSTADLPGQLPSTSPRAEVIFGNSDKAVTFGVNWYANKWVKIQFNFIRETLADPSLGPLPQQPSFNSKVIRFMFQL